MPSQRFRLFVCGKLSEVGPGLSEVGLGLSEVGPDLSEVGPGLSEVGPRQLMYKNNT